MMTFMGHSPELTRAVDRAQAFFEGRNTKASVLARDLQRRTAGDPRLVEHLVRARRRRTRMDGSVDGSLVRTAWVAWELLELGCPIDHAAVVRTVGYVLGRQDQPGHFAEGCSPPRHVSRLCCHYVRAFFSPGPRDVPVAPLEFPSGLLIVDEEEARFAASCFALRVVLRAGEERREAVRTHLDTLLALIDGWQPGDRAWSANLVLFVLGALAYAPPEYRPQLQELTNRVTALQYESGEWKTVDVFHTLEVLHTIPTDAARAAVMRTVPYLCGVQRDTGAFDETESELRALIALRALVLARSLEAADVRVHSQAHPSVGRWSQFPVT